jgi:hypothetical protein
VTQWLKAGILERIDAAIARQRCSKYVSAATNQHTIAEELLEAVSSVQSTPSLYSEKQLKKLALRVV